MADYEQKRSAHETLVADVEDVVTLTTVEFNRVEVLNRHATGWIYFTVDGETAEVEGNDTFAVAPNSGVTVADLSVATETDVHLISAVNAPYSVTGYSESE
jgi:hypothetical protein